MTPPVASPPVLTPTHPAPTAHRPPPRWRSSELLPAGPVAEIDHDGQIYRLRRTAQGKLILTK